MTYEEALRTWVGKWHPLALEDHIEIEASVDGYATCGYSAVIEILVNGRVVRTYSGYALDEILRELIA